MGDGGERERENGRGKREKEREREVGRIGRREEEGREGIMDTGQGGEGRREEEGGRTDNGEGTRGGGRVESGRGRGGERGERETGEGETGEGGGSKSSFWTVRHHLIRLPRPACDRACLRTCSFFFFFLSTVRCSLPASVGGAARRKFSLP